MSELKFTKEHEWIGISNRDDVSKAMKLGSQGILVASGVIKATSWEKKITELASGMKG